MLSYRHAFHAGNHADVLKHIVLVRILGYMTQKDKPLCYIDTHAGPGVYDLRTNMANKTAEYAGGIGRLWQRDDLPEELLPYIELITRLNAGGDRLHHYPGSPWLACQLLRKRDRLCLSELHSTDFPVLQQNFAADRRVHCYHEDGYQKLLALLPPLEKRACILIDPAYEQKQEYRQVIDHIAWAYKKFPTAVYMLWYPVVERDYVLQLEKRLKATDIRDICRFELGIAADDSGQGMTASGVIVINPPWHLKQEMQRILPWLVKHMTASGHYYAEQLAEE